jgi:hypothetical protein
MRPQHCSRQNELFRRSERSDPSRGVGLKEILVSSFAGPFGENEPVAQPHALGARWRRAREKKTRTCEESRSELLTSLGLRSQPQFKSRGTRSPTPCREAGSPSSWSSALVCRR